MSLLILYALLGIVFFGLAGGLYIFNIIFKKKSSKPSKIRKATAEFFTYSKDEKIIAVISAAKTRWKQNPLETVTVKSHDGLKLSGDLWINHDKKNDLYVAIVIHGFGDSASGMAYLAEEYYQRGFSVLAIDCRAHGNSEGKLTGMGFWDAQDLVFWIDFIINRFGSKCKIVLHGVSMGGASVLTYSGLAKDAVKRQSQNIMLLISDCAFSSFATQIDFQLQKIIQGRGLHQLIRSALLFGSSAICFLQNHFFYFQHQPAKKVSLRHKNNLAQVPLVIFHGDADILVLETNAQTIYNSAQGNKNIEIIHTAPHIGAYFYEPSHYLNTIMNEISQELE